MPCRLRDVGSWVVMQLSFEKFEFLLKSEIVQRRNSKKYYRE